MASVWNWELKENNLYSYSGIGYGQGVEIDKRCRYTCVKL